MSTDSGSCGSLDRAQARMAMFEYQSPAVLDQAAPVQNDWYDILPETDNVRVYGIWVNIEDTNETLEVQALVNGQTIESQGVACSNSTSYKAMLYGEPITRTDRLGLTTANFVEDNRRSSHLFDGRSVQIQVRKTTAAGVGNLTGIVLYGVLTRV